MADMTGLLGAGAQTFGGAAGGLGGSLGGLVGGYFTNQAQRQQNQIQMLGAKMGLAQAMRNKMLTEFDNRMAQRRAEEAAAGSGVYDPSDPMNVGAQAVKRTTDRGNIILGGANDQVKYAGKQVSALKKYIDNQRQAYYANMALHLLGAGFGAASMWPSSPQQDWVPTPYGGQ